MGGDFLLSGEGDFENVPLLRVLKGKGDGGVRGSCEGGVYLGGIFAVAEKCANFCELLSRSEDRVRAT